MANTAQARKRARQATKQRAHNASLRSTLRTAIKKILKSGSEKANIESQKTIEEVHKIVGLSLS